MNLYDYFRWIRPVCRKPVGCLHLLSVALLGVLPVEAMYEAGMTTSVPEVSPASLSKAPSPSGYWMENLTAQTPE